ncbi:hypothetical protein QJQ45_006402 [Haematococcus lacustris]|nr:hypothetical protein QJQ45_006402 [Haematococcus lacustris]
MDMGCGGGDGGGGGSLPQVLEDPKWPAQWPFKPSDFQRYDEQPDTQFYSQPRFVTHIDDYAISALTKHYAQRFPPSGTPGTALLDICSSWVSHYPDGYKADKVSGLGMNADELKRNPQLTDWLVADLNKEPKLPYPDNTFDVVTNVVSVDYLNKPLEVFREMHRVLKPGGTAMMSFSNRCFPTKAIQLWTATADPDHVWIVGAYFHYSVPGGFTAPTAADISPKLGFRSDPMPAGWKPPAGQVEQRLLRSAWSQRRDQPVRGMMWCPVVAPRKPPQAPRSSQEATPTATSEPGPSTPPPAKRSKRTMAEPAAEPIKGKGKGKGKAAKAKPAPQPGRWLDRDCNAALNMQRIGESRWRPLELCYWPEQGALPAKGKEYPGLG